MEGNSPLIRQWRILRTLSARRYGVTVKELAEEASVTEKTIRRDLNMFEAAGFPLEETTERFGLKKWKLESDVDPLDLCLLWDEAAALYLGQRFLEPLAGTPFWEAAGRAFKKIRATLGERPLKYLEKFSPLFHQTTVGASDYTKKTEIIDELMVGIEDTKAVFIAYRSLRATEPTTYDIYPYGLVFHRGSLYLVGKHLDKNEICHWKVDRITEAGHTNVHFQRPDDFNLQEHLSKTFGIFKGDGEVRVTIRFSSAVARYVEESNWHASQKLSKQRDGSLLAEFELDGTEEIKRWILSFGRQAEVIKPERLRSELLEECQRMQEKYIPKNESDTPSSKKQKQS
jgi:proteasome accessory factor B